MLPTTTPVVGTARPVGAARPVGTARPVGETRPVEASERPDLTPADLDRSRPFLPSGPGAGAGQAGTTTARSTPWYRHWGFWTGVGAVVVAGTVTAIAVATSSGDPAIPDGNGTLDFGR